MQHSIIIGPKCAWSQEHPPVSRKGRFAHRGPPEHPPVSRKGHFAHRGPLEHPLVSRKGRFAHGARGGKSWARGSFPRPGEEGRSIEPPGARAEGNCPQT